MLLQLLVPRCGEGRGAHRPQPPPRLRAGIVDGEKFFGDVISKSISFPEPSPLPCASGGCRKHLGSASLDRWHSCQGYGQSEGCPSGTWPEGFLESMWACSGEVGPDHLEGPGPTWTGPVLGGLRPGTGQVISQAGVYTASPMGLWASVSQGVETLSCGKDSTLKSIGLDWSVSC